MDRQQYLIEIIRQLSNTKHYKPISNSIRSLTQIQLWTIIQTLYNKKYISAKQKYFLFGLNDPRPRHFYLLPKIHKDPLTWTTPFEVPPGRPLVSDCNSATYNISNCIDHFLSPLANKHPSCLKDTYHFLSIIRPMAVPTHSVLFTIDVDSLYTNIQTEARLRATASVFTKYPDNTRPDQYILQILEICLNNNDFTFNNNHYFQVSGPKICTILCQHLHE